MSGTGHRLAFLVFALLAAGVFTVAPATARGGAGAGVGAFGGGGVGGIGTGGGGPGLPPSITEPGWGRDVSQCYETRLIHTRHGAQWRRIWACP